MVPQLQLANTHAWLKRYGIKMRRFKLRTTDDTIGPMGQKSKVRGKNNDNASLMYEHPIV